MKRLSPRKGPHSTAKVRNLKGLKAALKACQLDARTAVSKEIRELRDELIEDMGGKDAVSVQQLAVIDQTAKSYLLLQYVDGFVFGQLFAEGKVLDRRRRRVHEIVFDRQRMAKHLNENLQLLGLEKKRNWKTLTSGGQNGAA